MIATRGRSVALVLTLVGAAACGDSNDSEGGQKDSGTVPTLDSGSGGGTDAGTSADSGPKDSGAASDAGSAVDGGSMDSATSGNDAAAANVIATSTGSWTLFMNPYGDGGANPAMGIQGSALAVHAGDGGMKVTLNVSGLPGARGFGSHLHKLTCDMMTAGGHFQHMPAPADASVNDPAYGNPMNEVWLDFTTDDAGMAMASANVNWVPGDGGANAIVVHDHLTADGGVAGPKLACLPMPF